jgi:hypothetical protein
MPASRNIQLTADRPFCRPDTPGSQPGSSEQIAKSPEPAHVGLGLGDSQTRRDRLDASGSGVEAARRSSSGG